jgi:hypothetical protein
MIASLNKKFRAKFPKLHGAIRKSLTVCLPFLLPLLARVLNKLGYPLNLANENGESKTIPGALSVEQIVKFSPTKKLMRK